jgi:BlaI family penicillinase repressor
MARKKRRATLTKVELEMMRVLWDSPDQPLTVRDVLTRINEGRRKPAAYTTVQTVLMILKDKQVVHVEPGPGRAHTFSPLLSREEVTASMVGDLVERLFDGRVRPLIHRLVDDKSLSTQELQDLKEWIEIRIDDAPPEGA